MNLARAQLESIIGDIHHYQEELTRVKDISQSLRFYWKLREDISNSVEVSPEILGYFDEEIVQKLRWLRDHLLTQVNLASYIESKINDVGELASNKLLDDGGDDGDDWDGEWQGTSTIRTRLLNLMHSLGHSPEQASDALVQVCHDERSETLSFLLSDDLSPYVKTMGPAELKKRVRVHVFGQAHEDALEQEQLLARQERQKK